MGFYKDGATDPAISGAQEATAIEFAYADPAVDAEREPAQVPTEFDKDVQNLDAPEAYRAGVQSDEEVARVGDDLTATE